jgi:hypothetical protein
MNSVSSEKWIQDLRDYCRSLNIDIEDLHAVLNDPKVAPMIRGKAFEFSVSARLSQILSDKEWSVSKPVMNAQTGSHDVDVKVTHKPTKKIITVECKLAAKGGFRVVGQDEYSIRVKCMRSRTTKSPDKVKSNAATLRVSEDAFLIHSDQYRALHFDIVATSIANAFYETDETDGYVFAPNKQGSKFIQQLHPPNDDWQSFLYNKIYLARSVDLIVSKKSNVTCTRRECRNKTNCGFIPNYPLINFKLNQKQRLVTTNHWLAIEQVPELFRKFIR